jgi:hypothetical protein
MSKLTEQSRNGFLDRKMLLTDVFVVVVRLKRSDVDVRLLVCQNETVQEWACVPSSSPTLFVFIARITSSICSVNT